MICRGLHLGHLWMRCLICRIRKAGKYDGRMERGADGYGWYADVGEV
jgi:hypothetical protein